jgi:Spy/CpxP family protein refolding chaperone
MRKTKHTTLVITVVMALALVGGFALAHDPGERKGYGDPGAGRGWTSNLSPEQQERLRAQEQKFYEDTATLRTELYQRRLELQGLIVDPQADPETIKAKQQELFDLERQFQERALEHRLAVREVLDDRHHHGWGHPWGKSGFGAKRGYARGYCW